MPRPPEMGVASSEALEAVLAEVFCLCNYHTLFNCKGDNYAILKMGGP